MHQKRQVSDVTRGLLSEHFGNTRHLLQITMLAGHYEMLAGLLNSACLPLEAGTEEQLASAEIHHRP